MTIYKPEPGIFENKYEQYVQAYKHTYTVMLHNINAHTVTTHTHTGTHTHAHTHTQYSNTNLQGQVRHNMDK